jgi:hypothetical protein
MAKRLHETTVDRPGVPCECGRAKDRRAKRCAYCAHLPEGARERFMAKVNKTETCWLWTGARGGLDRKTRIGRYGRVAVGGGKTDQAHRVAYEMFVGPVPEGHYVLHRCDVSLCVRPDHLFTGTQTDNMRDMVAKDRCSRRGNPGPRRPREVSAV